MKMPVEPFRSDFYLWQGFAAVFFSSCVTPVHAHNTIQILVDLQKNFKCRVGNGGWQTCRQLIIAENVPHQLDTNDSVQLLIYVDTETSTGQQIRAKYLQGKTHDVPATELLTLANPEALQRCLLKSEPDLLRQIVTNILTALSGQHALPATEERVTTVKQQIALLQPAELSILGLAQGVFLSESRLRALFKKETGTSIYQYLLWRRIGFALNLVMLGHTVNEAALEAGFYDSSHFHKLLVNMFGLSPSQFIKGAVTSQKLVCAARPLALQTILV